MHPPENHRLFPNFFPSYSHEKKSYSHEFPKYFCNLLNTNPKSSKFFPRKKKLFPSFSHEVPKTVTKTCPKNQKYNFPQPQTEPNQPKYLKFLHNRTKYPKSIKNTFNSNTIPTIPKEYLQNHIEPLQSTKTFFQSIPLKK